MTKVSEFLQGMASEIVVAFIEGLGIVMGKAPGKVDATIPYINNPRLVQMRADKEEGKQVIVLSRLVGDPDKLFFIKEPIFMYEVRDKGGLDSYTKSVTNLIMATNLPH
jgi:hypothetical protein